MSPSSSPPRPEVYLRDRDRLAHAGLTPAPDWLRTFQQTGATRFADTGLPTLEHEDWRFTSLAPLYKLPFKPLPAARPSPPAPLDPARFPLAGLEALRLVFVDGRFAPEYSAAPRLTDGVCVASLATILAEHPDWARPHLGTLTQTEPHPFADLNAAWFTDGAFIRVCAGHDPGVPVHLVFLSTASETGRAAQPRNLILVEDRARLTVLESHASLGQAASFTNAVTELYAGPQAVVEHCKFQDENAESIHLAAIHAELGAGASVVSHSIATGARLSRNNIRTRLAGPGVECVLNGLYVTHGDQVADHHMIVEHAEPHGASHEYFNGILDGRSKGVFHGRILVRPAAQKTDAKQTNKNLLLSDSATANTKPQLEIYADDVKCTHGATVGQLNEEAVFYLRTRGVGLDTARRMLIHSFAGEIIERVRWTALRETLDQLIWDRLEANPHVAGPR